MKNISAFISITASLTLPSLALATTLNNPLMTTSTIPDLIITLVDIVAFIATPVIVMYIIYAGYLIVSAGGDEEKLADGKRAFMWGFVGAAIILGANVLARLIASTMSNLL